MDTSGYGTIAELKVQADLVRRGYEVFSSITVSHIDLVICRNENLESIQVKYVTPKNGIMRVPLRKQATHHAKPEHRYSYGEKTLDWMAVYNPENDKVYYLPRNIWANKKSNLSLRLVPAKSNRKKDVHFADNYLNI